MKKMKKIGSNHEAGFTQMSMNGGFTLIELLMVIVIIGLLSSIILASLNNSRNKGLNSQIRSQLVSARTAAEVYRDRVGNYGPSVEGSCTQGGSHLFKDTASGMVNFATVSNYPASVSLVCYSDGTNWAMSASLVGGGEGGFAHWCVDSWGNSKGRTNPIGLSVLSSGC